LPAERHDYGVTKRAAMYNFLAHHLKLNIGSMEYDNGYDEGFLTILSEENLKVFGKEYPMPENALQGDEAVIKYLISHKN
ncbi:acetylxylan esterase, partial [candidate division KSB1 bacterium]|nr:acetylxylan esterase [candidate division KSB1 bacterium]